MPGAGVRLKFFAVLLLFSLLIAVPASIAGEEYISRDRHSGSILIGLIPEMNVFKQMERFQVLADYLTKKTGYTVRLTVLSRYGNVLEKFKEKKMDGAFLGSFTGALAIMKLGLEPVARPVNPDGIASYSGYIFVRKDSGIRTVEQMKGKKIAYVDRATTAGYIFPVAYLKDHGVKDINRFFKEYYFTGSHDAAVYAVLNKQADIGTAKNTIYNLLKQKEPRIEKELLILAESPKVPSNGLCLRKDFDPVLRKKLHDLLLGMDKDKDGRKVLADFGALRFIETKSSDYEPVFKLAASAGIDIRNYTYVNR